MLRDRAGCQLCKQVVARVVQGSGREGVGPCYDRAAGRLWVWDPCKHCPRLQALSW